MIRLIADGTISSKVKITSIFLDGESIKMMCENQSLSLCFLLVCVSFVSFHPDRFQSLTVLPSVSHANHKLIWKIWFHSLHSCDHKLSRPHWVTRGPDFDLIPWLIFTWPTDFESLNFHQLPDSIEWFRIDPKKFAIRELHDSTDLIHRFAIRLTDSAVICTPRNRLSSTIFW